MRELEVFRKHDRERAQKSVGVYGGPNLQTKSAVASAQADHDVERMPEAFDENCELQSAGGAWLFMIDYDPIDGAPIG